MLLSLSSLSFIIVLNRPSSSIIHPSSISFCSVSSFSHFLNSRDRKKVVYRYVGNGEFEKPAFPWLSIWTQHHFSFSHKLQHLATGDAVHNIALLWKLLYLLIKLKATRGFYFAEYWTEMESPRFNQGHFPLSVVSWLCNYLISLFELKMQIAAMKQQQ